MSKYAGVACLAQPVGEGLVRFWQGNVPVTAMMASIDDELMRSCHHCRPTGRTDGIGDVALVKAGPAGSHGIQAGRLDGRHAIASQIQGYVLGHQPDDIRLVARCTPCWIDENEEQAT